MTFGSGIKQVLTLTIDSDPGSGPEIFYLGKAPEGGWTVEAFYVSSEQTQNAGTAVVLKLEDWGLHGLAVAGTIASAGGTAAAAVLTARTPGTATVDTARNYLPAGTQLVVSYTEEGTGWIANDRFWVEAVVTVGKGNTTE